MLQRFTFALAALLCAMTAAQGMQMPSHEMPSSLGPYPMTREGSGTSWQPDATPMGGLMFHGDPWMVMVHGFVNVVFDDQGGPRGGGKTFASSMAMAMASRPIGRGTLGLRAMLSLDPTIGRGGYPLLLQTGETADGVTHLVDRQHPHDAFMELAGSYSLPFGDKGSVFIYAGLPGEPALGPSTFMHRFSGMRIPEAPLSHHWLDSTHITMGVVTLGASHGAWKIEASTFNGREPDQNRWNIETRRFDSHSARISFNPTAELSLQVSHGKLASPEGLEPETEVKRTTASVAYQSRLGNRPWGTTLAWGRNDKSGHGAPRKLDGWLLESTLAISDRDTVFGRVEQVNNDELFDHDDPLQGRAFRVGKLSLGYIREIGKTGAVSWGLGGLASAFRFPGEMRASYGANPRAYMVFLQARL